MSVEKPTWDRTGQFTDFNIYSAKENFYLVVFEEKNSTAIFSRSKSVYRPVSKQKRVFYNLERFCTLIVEKQHLALI